MCVVMSLKDSLQLLLGMRSSNEHQTMPKWEIFNASEVLALMGMGISLKNHVINIQWTKFEQKSIVTFISVRAIISAKSIH